MTGVYTAITGTEKLQKSSMFSGPSLLLLGLVCLLYEFGPQLADVRAGLSNYMYAIALLDCFSCPLFSSSRSKRKECSLCCVQDQATVGALKSHLLSNVDKTGCLPPKALVPSCLKKKSIAASNGDLLPLSLPPFVESQPWPKWKDCSLLTKPQATVAALKLILLSDAALRLDLVLSCMLQNPLAAPDRVFGYQVITLNLCRSSMLFSTVISMLYSCQRALMYVSYCPNIEGFFVTPYDQRSLLYCRLNSGLHVNGGSPPYLIS